ncbi:hypothetical protein [Asanoa ishikariensis]|uniref:hypothetical protein n=1 Tax=Asanoa ishikariensis TaxID=137265 RepID=UPI000B8594E1|nr:hypothetical protein [Asanoa ishikariensis]
MAYAFRRWELSSQQRSAHRDGDSYAGRDHDDWPEDWRSGDCHVRTLLEHAAWALRRKARRELRHALRPLDDRYLARTINNPFVRQHHPWWLRRIEL